MNRHEIQNFILWYIPAILGAHFVSVALFLSEDGSVSLGYRADFALSALSYVVCGLWLFVNGPKHNLNRWLWGIFGLGAHLFAVLLYFAYVAFNQATTGREVHDTTSSPTGQEA
ncbi:MAG: hypothetical protein AMJ69_06950 [Gammaproteobacteria bacterium SG8_47]|nr:MAG: hypothetical protein AMJ69_06950 [Gammaproteobacteria bacterium SG8_47]